jgi:hypothetical protein
MVPLLPEVIYLPSPPPPQAVLWDSFVFLTSTSYSPHFGSWPRPEMGGMNTPPSFPKGDDIRNTHLAQYTAFQTLITRISLQGD